MTPDELRRLAEEATQRPQDDMEMMRYYTAQNSLIALTPDLARLCAEMAEALDDYIEALDGFAVGKHDDPQWPEQSFARLRAALAKLSELEAR